MDRARGRFLLLDVQESAGVGHGETPLDSQEDRIGAGREKRGRGGTRIERILTDLDGGGRADPGLRIETNSESLPSDRRESARSASLRVPSFSHSIISR